MSNPASSNAMSSTSNTTTITTVSSFSNKSCYRLYAGHGNWINLNAKTTQDLVNIFAKGEPCRYQLAAGLFIDIIPNDVDCNSKNIDMVGLMRADLVYEPQMMENHVQQLMSHYIRSLLDEQGIIDAFPPLRQREDLPIITSLPTHRHLSLVPSVLGAVRRGPKSTTSSSNSTAAQQRKVVSSSSSSSVALPDDEPLALSSSSSSSATHDSLTLSNVGSTNSRKRALNPSSGGGGSTVTTRRSHLKRGRQNNDHVDSIELMSQYHHPTKRHMMSLELPNLNTGALAATTNASGTHLVFNTNNTASLGMPSFMDHTTHHGHNGLIGFHHHHQQSQQQQQQHGNGFWLSSYQNSPIPINSRSSSSGGGNGGGFNFEFGMDFDHTLQQHAQPQAQHKQSPTELLHDYDMSHQMMSNDLYSNNNAVATVTAANAAVTHMHPHQHHHVDHSHLLNDNQQQQQHMMATASCSDTTSLESFVPASPIPTNWLETTHHHQQQSKDSGGHWQHSYAPSSATTTTTATDSKAPAALTTATASLDANGLKKLKFEYNNNAVIVQDVQHTTTDVSLPVVDFENDTGGSSTDNNNNLGHHDNDDSKDHVFLAHVDALSSSPSTSSSTSSPTTTSQ